MYYLALWSYRKYFEFCGKETNLDPSLFAEAHNQNSNLLKINATLQENIIFLARLPSTFRGLHNEFARKVTGRSYLFGSVPQTDSYGWLCRSIVSGYTSYIYLALHQTMDLPSYLRPDCASRTCWMFRLKIISFNNWGTGCSTWTHLTTRYTLA